MCLRGRVWAQDDHRVSEDRVMRGSFPDSAALRRNSWIATSTSLTRRTCVPISTIEHCPTGIAGLDEITSGGLPRGRTTLLSGGPGCGKTLIATTFLVNGAAAGEPGVFITFEEREADLV